jgi:hypothetical protein
MAQPEQEQPSGITKEELREIYKGVQQERATHTQPAIDRFMKHLESEEPAPTEDWSPNGP